MTFALCADPRVDAAIAFDGLTVPIVWKPLPLQSCMDLNGAVQPADAHIRTGLSLAAAVGRDGVYSGRVTFTLASARIEMPALRWPRMSAGEWSEVGAISRAVLWHELGHLVTARDSIAVENARADDDLKASSRTAFADLARAREQAAFARIDADQDAYDALTAHGVRQDRASLPLAGADTVAHCDPR